MRSERIMHFSVIVTLAGGVRTKLSEETIISSYIPFEKQQWLRVRAVEKLYKKAWQMAEGTAFSCSSLCEEERKPIYGSLLDSQDK